MSFQKELIDCLEKNGEKTAIEYNGSAITYSQLLQSANNITGFLLNQSLESETVVGVMVPGRADMISAMIGVMNSRCVFVPVDGTMPDGRLDAIIQNLDLRYIITSLATNLQESYPGLKIFLLEDMMGYKQAVNKPAYPAFNEEDSLYIYFTSGSTGMPKGIVGKNKSLLQFLKWETGTFGIDNSYRVSQFISPYFDAFLRDVFVPLLAGGTICIPPGDDDFFTPEKIVPWLDELRINLVHCVPSVFRTINNGAVTAENFKELKYILLSGEKIIPAELVKWYNTFGERVQLVNLYGTTETTMIRSYYNIQPADTGKSRIPIGYPIHDTQLLISKKDLKPCNMLIPGELYIISPYTSKGYLNNPELTHEKFIKIKTDAGAETIAFRTGDIARTLADGKIDLAGREDRQVKISGIRVELDEIENVLLRSGIVKNALIYKKIEDNGNEILVAFIIRHETLPDGFDLPAETRHYLEQYLPAYMMPSAIVEVNEFPLMVSGKINFQQLLTSLETTAIQLPSNKTEEILLGIWKEIVGDKPISVTESFQRVGGNSLSIMRLIGRIHREFNVRISLSEIFNNLTIEKQAQIIEQLSQDTALVIAAAVIKQAYRASTAQERIYQTSLAGKKPVMHNMPVIWDIPVDAGKKEIEKIFRALIQRHEALRTRFETVEGKLLQVIENEIVFSVQEINSETVQHAMIDFIKPFDLAKAPLVRAAVITVEGSKNILAVDIHQAICDAVSQNNLFYDFTMLVNGEVPEPLAVQYKDYAEWEHQFKSTEQYIAYREFWLRQYEQEAPKLDLPVVHGITPEQGHETGEVSFTIDRNELQPVIDRLANDGVAVYPALFSVYFIFLSQLTGQEEIVIGIIDEGRLQPETNGIVGVLTKTLPIRYQMDPGVTFVEFAGEINDCINMAGDKQFYELNDIMEEMNNNRTEPVTLLFQTMFLFRNYESGSRPAGSKVYTVNGSGGYIDQCPVSLTVEECEREFVFILKYLPAYFTLSDAELLVTQFKTLVSKIAESPVAKIIQYSDNHIPVMQVKEDNILFSF